MLEKDKKKVTAMLCNRCNREYVKKGKQCTVCYYRYSELRSVLVVMGVLLIGITPGIVFVTALVRRLLY